MLVRKIMQGGKNNKNKKIINKYKGCPCGEWDPDKQTNRFPLKVLLSKDELLLFRDLQDLPSSNGMKYSVKKLRIALKKKKQNKKPSNWKEQLTTSLPLRTPKYSREMDKAVLFRK